ncbi:MAG: alpha/beta hydrolase [Phycisphaerales bacterium]|nr:alpha/beta hydrolase [Phycisphaerales bacterium]
MSVYSRGSGHGRIGCATFGLWLLCGASIAAAQHGQTKPQTATPPQAATPITLRFVVATPPDGAAPAATEIHCSMSIDSWPEGGRPLRMIAPNLYEATLQLYAGENLEYKFCREKSWRTVEKDANGAEITNRKLTLDASTQSTLVVFHAIVRWADREPASDFAARFSSLDASAAAEPAKSTRSGDIRVHADFASPQLGNKRTILVYLPRGYEKNINERYPVLYMHDGNNVFDAAGSANNMEWGADEAAEKLIEQKVIEKIMIVAIYNTENRFKEYTPFVDKNYGGGEGDKYLQFVVETLKPFIDKTYRTRPEREHTAICGSSLGGLISLYALQKYPEVFGGAGVVSPALWWSERQMLKILPADYKRPVRIWIDIGTGEGKTDGAPGRVVRAVEDARALVAILEEKKLKKGDEFVYEEIENGSHNERAWAARFDRVLKYLFPPQ